MTAFTGSKWFPNGLAPLRFPSSSTKPARRPGHACNGHPTTTPRTRLGCRVFGGAFIRRQMISLAVVWERRSATNAWALARSLYDGSVTNFQSLSPRANSTPTTSRFVTVRCGALYYKVLTSTNVEGPYTDGGQQSQRALEASIPTTNSLGGAGSSSAYRDRLRPERQSVSWPWSSEKDFCHGTSLPMNAGGAVFQRPDRSAGKRAASVWGAMRRHRALRGGGEITLS
jgi:hypothetical protein